VRVVHFSDTYLPRRDGVITSLRTLTAEQVAAGHATLTVVPRDPEQVPEAALLTLRALPVGPANLRISPWPLRPAGATATLRRILRFNPDVIHVHTPGPIGLLGVLASRRLNLPLVQTYHTDLHAYAEAYRVPVRALRAGVRLYARRLSVARPPMPPVASGPRSGRRARAGVQRRAALDACNTLLLGGADVIIVPTRAVLDRVTLPVPDGRIFIIPTGVGAPRATPRQAAAFRTAYGIGPDEPVVLYVGRVNREKGIELLIAAFSDVLARRPDARLVLVGAVYEPRWLAGLLRCGGAGHGQPPLTERVVLAGEQPPDVVAAAYGAAQVFAFPSRTDTQALVLQEAALAGLPVVMVDPLLHAVSPLGGNAVLADAHPRALGTAVAQILNAPAEAGAMGALAAAAASHHTPDGYAAAVEQAYEYARLRVAMREGTTTTWLPITATT
jgi:1,2-diacylglycerol 3-alpha-glucosyltransferase